MLTLHPDTTAPVSTIDRKRFHINFSTHLPLILLNSDGTIAHVAAATRKLLGYPPTQLIDSEFTSLVHGKNLRQVMSDIASMQRGTKRKAFWLARLRAGDNRWKWFRISVDNVEQEDERLIILRLKDLQD